MIKQILIDLPLPFKVSTNDIYRGRHWRYRMKIADLYHRSLIEHRAKKIKGYPVTITYNFEFKSRPLDSSNCTYMAKMLEDALRFWKILQDDSPKFVDKMIITSRKTKKDHVTITIEWQDNKNQA